MYTQGMVNTKSVAGFAEIEHTADWELHVWGPDMAALLEQAAFGMYMLSQTRLIETPRLRREFEIMYQDDESLVVDFLAELLFYAEGEGIAFDAFQIEIRESSCRFQASGASILEQTKEIKAVTYHGMVVRHTERGLDVNIVFDV